MSVEYIRFATVHADTDVANPLKRMDDEVQKVFLLLRITVLSNALAQLYYKIVPARAASSGVSGRRPVFEQLALAWHSIMAVGHFPLS